MSANKLTLPLKTKWFKMTKAGIKTEDYREINQYWVRRLMSEAYNIIYSSPQDSINGIFKNTDPNFLVKHHSKKFESNVMTLGYPKKGDQSRVIEYEHKGIELRTGNPEWGAEPGKLYFVILHGNRINQNSEQ